ncbi:MAG: outer membrane lipoprotein chaperone LolA [Ignavibacteriales bacterium]|nr:outer membrane lipoprotein chaperone LolA [Ignavibacteriales bacterium]
MIRHTKYFFVLFIASLCAAQEQSSLTAMDVVGRVQALYASLTDASADFTQTVKFKYTKTEQKFAGTARMKKGNRYRVESQQQTLVTDGKIVWVYSPVNKQVVVDAYKENAQTFSPEKFIFGLPKNYTAAFVGEKKSGVHVLKLAPRSGTNAFIKSLKVWVSETDWTVQRVEIIDGNEMQTIYTVQNFHRNPGLSDALFSFVAPPGVETVDLRSMTSPTK